MEEQNKPSSVSETKAAAQPTKPAEQKQSTDGGGPTSSRKEPEAEATYYSSQTMYYKDGDTSNPSSKKPQYQVTTVLVKAKSLG